MKTPGFVQMVALAAAAVIIAGPALAYPGQRLASHAKISMQRARQLALHEYPGKIVTGELETERGGSGLRFSFDVRGSRGLREIGIDAKTGKVLENSVEGPNAD